MTVAAVLDPSDFGTDVLMVEDVSPVWGICTGFANLARALARRLITDRFGLFYDPPYGYNTINLLNAGWTPVQLSKAQQDVSSECEKDERVRRCKAAVVFNPTFQTLTITVTCVTALGPFQMVMSVSLVTVEILRVNGVQFNEVVSAAAAAAPVIVVTTGGGSSGTGPPGPPGPAGGASQSFDFGDTSWGDSSGTEVVQLQREVNMGSLPASLTAELAAQVDSAAGTATFRVRLGGGDRTADGTVLLTMTSTSPSFEEKVATGSFTNPNGLQRLKITIESSANGVGADVKDATVTLR